MIVALISLFLVFVYGLGLYVLIKALFDFMNDLWCYDPATNEWTKLIKGDEEDHKCTICWASEDYYPIEDNFNHCFLFFTMTKIIRFNEQEQMFFI